MLFTASEVLMVQEKAMQMVRRRIVKQMWPNVSKMVNLNKGNRGVPTFLQCFCWKLFLKKTFKGT
jgi:hypothetical protein